MPSLPLDRGEVLDAKTLLAILWLVRRRGTYRVAWAGASAAVRREAGQGAAVEAAVRCEGDREPEVRPSLGAPTEPDEGPAQRIVGVGIRRVDLEERLEGLDRPRRAGRS